mgnify:CR=1 FL=1
MLAVLRIVCGLPGLLKRPEQLGKITANPAGTNAQRFVVVGVELGLNVTDADGEAVKPSEVEADADAMAKIDANLGKIKSIIVTILGRKYIDQYETEMPEIAETRMPPTFSPEELANRSFEGS